MSATELAVDHVDGRHRVRMRHGALRAQRVHGPPDRARVVLVARTALLLGGDRVEIDVRVGPAATLELSEVAGTVAYHGRGRPAWWVTRIRLDAGARLSWSGAPFVVADGAEVNRSLVVALAPGARLELRDTLVLGRSGEAGGRLEATSMVRRSGRTIMAENLVLDPATRDDPGLLGGARVLDTLLCVGVEPPEIEPGAVRYGLAEPDGWLVRFLGTEAAASPIRPPTDIGPPKRSGSA